MADLKVGEPFGLDQAMIDAIDWPLAIERILNDLKTDFIYAPHLSFVYRNAKDELVSLLKTSLKSGTFGPGMPITIEVPKPFRISVRVQSKRLGPNYSRPGSILLPLDRVLYQALADQAAPIIDAKTDKSRSFSHQLAAADNASMFLPTRTCWNAFQKSLSAHAQKEKIRYILKVDVANFFGSLNQHILINLLNDAGYPKSLSSRLENFLTSHSGRSSRGILQGVYPSDLFGNYYLSPIDLFLTEYGVASSRYVDDIYIFVPNVESTDRLMRELIPTLRRYDLVLNEAKSVIILKSALITEEPDLEELFDNAVKEIADQVDEDDFDADYGFQSEWNDDNDEDEEEEEEGGTDTDSDLELKATELLFDSVSKYPGHEESIERFCLPLFSAAESDYALEHVMASFVVRPAMTQIYSSYVAKFIRRPVVLDFLVSLLADSSLIDWQKMWIVAALSQADKAYDPEVKIVFDLFKDATRHEALRAVAVIYVGRFGNHTRRMALIADYGSATAYIQSAMYYSTKWWPSVEKGNVKAWAASSPLNKLISVAISRK